MQRLRGILSHMGHGAVLDLKTCQQARELQDIYTMFTISTSKLRQIQIYFLQEMLAGLRDTDGSSIQQLCSFVKKEKTDNISGTYFALDLGGTSFRVWKLIIDKGKILEKFETRVDIPEEHMTGTADGLFGFIAAKCKEVASSTEGDLGFTFSFPIQQHSVNHGTLIKWVKGFTTSGVEGKDPAILLKEAFNKQGVKLDVVALCNDTVGTLVAEYFNDNAASIGVILGTGSNACYWEKLSNIPKYMAKHPEEDPKQAMCINMEWADFDRDTPHRCLPLTQFDKMVDFYSAHPGNHLFEKMMSGKYIGEISRLIFDYLSSKRILPELPGIRKSENFESKDLSYFLSDNTDKLENIENFILERFRSHTSLFQRQTMKEICDLVSTRAARLAAAGIATIVSKISPEEDTTVSVDGSVYEYVPGFRKKLNDSIAELFVGMPSPNIKVVLTKGGSGVGAGLIAALVTAKN